MNTLTSRPREALRTLRSFLRGLTRRSNSASDRSGERYRRAALTGLSASLGKIISLGTSILTVRLTFRYLGAERYGMWMTITSIVMMFGFADLGMSNGLINLIADSMGREDRQAARQAVSSGFWMLSMVAAVLSIGAAIAYPFVDASRLFNVHSSLAMHESGPALLVFFACFALNLPLGTVRGTQSGMQQGFLNNMWSTLGTLLSLGAMLLAIHLHAGLPVLVLSLSLPPLVASLLNGVQVFGFSHPELLPRPTAFSSRAASRLLRTGLMYFLMQVSMSIGMQSDNVVIAQILGAKSVADYAVPARLFNIVTSFLVMISGAMLPAYAEAMARSDGHWIRKSFKRVAIAGTAATIVVAVPLTIFGNRILSIWVGPQMHVSMTLLAVFAIQCVVNAYLQPVSFLLNGIGRFRVQVICGVINAGLNLGLSIFFVKHYGIVGAVLGTVVSLIIVQVVPLTIVTRSALKDLGEHPAEPNLLRNSA